jgi:hypothetical protein
MHPYSILASEVKSTHLRSIDWWTDFLTTPFSGLAPVLSQIHPVSGISLSRDRSIVPSKLSFCVFGERLSRKSYNVVVFPFAFYIAVQQPLEPLWSRLLLCDHEPSQTSTFLCFMSLLM